MILYHTAYQEIRDPDIRFGRKNADFGQGFYLTKDKEFAKRWARDRAGTDTWVNTYELDPDGLQVLRLKRDENWFAFVSGNRAGAFSGGEEADVVIGPIANDTLYDTLGVFTSGILDKKAVLKLMLAGPDYEQIVIRTDKAREHLHWLASEKLEKYSIAGYREIVKKEEAAYQEEIARLLLEEE